MHAYPTHDACRREQRPGTTRTRGAPARSLARPGSAGDRRTRGERATPAPTAAFRHRRGRGRHCRAFLARRGVPGPRPPSVAVSLVLDAGPLLALLESDDPDHHRCVAMVERVGEDLVVPVPVLVEVDYWLRKLDQVNVWQTFVDDVAQGAYALAQTDEEHVLRAAELEAQYADLDLGFVDAAVIVTCERLG